MNCILNRIQTRLIANTPNKQYNGISIITETPFYGILFLLLSLLVLYISWQSINICKKYRTENEITVNLHTLSGTKRRTANGKLLSAVIHL